MSSRVVIARARRACRASSRTRGAGEVGIHTNSAHSHSRTGRGKPPSRCHHHHQHSTTAAAAEALRDGRTGVVRFPPFAPRQRRHRRRRGAFNVHARAHAMVKMSTLLRHYAALPPTPRRYSRLHIAFVHSPSYMHGVFTGFYTDNHLDSFSTPLGSARCVRMRKCI